MKTCKCGETDLSKFGKCKSNKGGLKYSCKACLKKYNSENSKKVAWQNKYYLKNREKIKCKNRKWREENKDKIAKAGKKYREENKERISERVSEWNQKNQERISEKQKKHYSEHKEKLNAGVRKSFLESNSMCKKAANNHCQKWTCHDFEIAVRKRHNGSYIFTAKVAALRLSRTQSSIQNVRYLNSKGTVPSDYTGKRSEYFDT